MIALPMSPADRAERITGRRHLSFSSISMFLPPVLSRMAAMTAPPPSQWPTQKGGTMRKRVTMDVFLVTLTVPHDLAEPEVTAIRRTLKGKDFQRRLRDAATETCRAFPSLRTVRLDISR
jgi:hypothetical protein